MSDQPQLAPSAEADERQIELAREAGEAYQRAADYMIEEVANTGDRAREDEYIVGIAQEEAEGMYHRRDGDLKWVEPANEENAHLEVLVASAADGRFLPELDVTVTLESNDGDTVGPVELPFVWHPGVYHYGKNLALPDDGYYSITVEVDAPTFPRHDETNGNRFADGVVVAFEEIDVRTGSE